MAPAHFSDAVLPAEQNIPRAHFGHISAQNVPQPDGAIGSVR